MEARGTRIGLWIWTVGVVLFLHIPLVIMGIYLTLAKRTGAFDAL